MAAVATCTRLPQHPEQTQPSQPGDQPGGQRRYPGITINTFGIPSTSSSSTQFVTVALPSVTDRNLLQRNPLQEWYKCDYQEFVLVRSKGLLLLLIATDEAAANVSFVATIPHQNLTKRVSALSSSGTLQSAKHEQLQQTYRRPRR
eukprot:2756346-Rhodomonas_salina.2